MIARLKYIFFIVAAIYTTACVGDQKEIPNEKPENLLSEEEFVNTYIEIRILESSIQNRIENTSVAKDVAKRSVDEYLEQKGVTYEDFMASFKYYGRQPKLMYDLFEKMLNRLNKQQSELRQDISQEQRDTVQKED